VALFIGDKVAEKENVVMQSAKRVYAPVLDSVMSNKPVILTLAVVAVILFRSFGDEDGQRVCAELE